MKILHLAMAVRNLDVSIAFYRDVMGLQQVGRRTFPELDGRECAFMRDNESGLQLELMYWKDRNLNKGDSLDHIAFFVPNMDEMLKSLEKQGIPLTQQPYSLGTSTNRIAAIADPDGITVEIIERK